MIWRASGGNRDNYIEPAHSAKGERCVQCGKPAWHVQLMPFCREHDQETYQREKASKDAMDNLIDTVDKAIEEDKALRKIQDDLWAKAGRVNPMSVQALVNHMKERRKE